MSDDLILEEILTIDLLKEVIDDAEMETSIEDGRLYVHNTALVLVTPEEDGDCIELMTLYDFKTETTELERLRAANRINDKIGIVRAIADCDYQLLVSWDIPIKGGITKMTFIYALETFCALQPLILEEIQVLIE